MFYFFFHFFFSATKHKLTITNKTNTIANSKRSTTYTTSMRTKRARNETFRRILRTAQEAVRTQRESSEGSHSLMRAQCTRQSKTITKRRFHVVSKLRNAKKKKRNETLRDINTLSE